MPELSSPVRHDAAGDRSLKQAGSPGVGSRERALGWLLMALHAVLFGLYVFGFRFLPLQDYPDWLFQGLLFKTWLSNPALLDGVYLVQPYLPPNAISTVVIGGLSWLMPAEIAGKIFLLLSMLVLYRGIFLFMGLTVKGNIPLRLLIAGALVFSYNFWLGNINFVMGLGAALCSIHLLIGRGWIDKIIPAAALLLRCYCCHFFSFCIVGLAVVLHLVMEKKWNALGRFVLACIPAAVLLLHYVANAHAATSDSDMVLPIAEQIRQRLAMMAGVLIPFPRFKGASEPGSVLKFFNYLYLGGIIVAIAASCIVAFRRRLRWFNIILAATVLPIILLLPLYTSGIVYPGERLVLFLLINILAFVLLRWPKAAPALGVCFALLNIGIALHAWDATARFDSMVNSGVYPSSERMMQLRGKGGSDGFLRIPFYEGVEALERRNQAMRFTIFQSGLFREFDMNREAEGERSAR